MSRDALIVGINSYKYPGLPNLSAPAEDAEAIALPAERVNLSVEEELIEQMLTDVAGAPGSLPLLQYTLTQLWEKRTDNQLKLSTYAQLGGIGGTLNQRAKEVYQQQFSLEQQDIAKQIFLCLTQLGEGTEDTRRRVLKTDLVTAKYSQSAIDEVIGELAKERLIVTSEQVGKGAMAERVVVVDVAHEALIRHWEDLRGWLDESRDALRKQREIEKEAKNWQPHANNDEESPYYLWKGPKLAEAEELLQKYATKVSLSNLAEEFMEACRDNELCSYLSSPEIDTFDHKKLEEEAKVKSFLTKDKLRSFMVDESKKAKVRLAASWLLKQWGENVPMWMAQTDGEENISLSIIELPPPVVEDLGDGISLEMVNISGGEFWMGASEGEEGSYRNQYPQHKVKVSRFLMGKYPVTQAQWRAVASLPEIERELVSEPSYYKGDDRRPVEYISWYDAIEFCERLSRFSLEKGKRYKYRLPSEAEWEYACRAGTTTAFHFGETITPDLANYIESARGKTTPVGRFQVANSFGLYDMHGQLWEWCADHWHDSYEGAPDDGRPWLRRMGFFSKKENQERVRRGGSWYGLSVLCRCAFRFSINPDDIDGSIGLRVVAAART